MSETEAILPLARAGAAQLASFGHFGRGKDAGEWMETVVQPRMAVWYRLFQLIDVAHPEGLAPAGEPLLYNLAAWPEGLPPAGYVGHPCAVGWVTQLTSRYSLWNLQLGAEPETATTWKLLRAALWVQREQGIHAALDYLVALLKAGYLFDAAPVANAMEILLEIRRRVPGDGDIVAALIEQPTADAAAWTRVGFLPIDLKAMPEIRDLSDDLEHLLDTAEREIDSMVLARSLDEWLMAQLFVRDLLNITRRLFERWELWSHLAFVGRTTRIEEIRADVGGFERVFRAYRGRMADEGFRYGPHFGVYGGLLTLMKDKMAPGDWPDRLLSERAMIPAELIDHMLRDGEVTTPARLSLPLAWQQVSAALAPMLAESLFRDPALAVSRPRPFRSADTALYPDTGQFFIQHGIDDPDVRAALIDRVCDRSNPLFGRPAKRRLEDAGYSSEAQDKLVDELNVTMALADIGHRLERADASRSGGNNVQTLAIWRETNADYPYFDYAMYEQAVALDEEGRPAEALPLLQDAILLRPSDPNRWQSLSIVFKRLGHAKDAAVAGVMAEQGAQTREGS